MKLKKVTLKQYNKSFIIPSAEMIAMITLADNDTQLAADFSLKYLKYMTEEDIKLLQLGLEIHFESILQAIWWLNAHKSWEQMKHKEKVIYKAIKEELKRRA